METTNPSTTTSTPSQDPNDDYDEVIRQQAELMKKKMQSLASKKKKSYFDSGYNYPTSQEETSREKLQFDDDEPLPDQISLEAAKDTPTLQDSSKEDPFTLSLLLQKKIIQASSFNTQTFPMLASFTAEDTNSSYKAPVDLVCVIDKSGSMGGEKISLVKQTFTYLLQYLRDCDRFSFVLFNNSASRLFPLIRTTDINKARILSEVDKIVASGGTNISCGMEYALEILKQRRQVNPVTSVFILSDGLDSGSGTQDRVRDLIARLGTPDDVTIHTFGFGSDHDSKVMTDISDLRDGNFYFIDELPKIDECFVDCLGGLMNAALQKVQLTIRPEQSESLQGVQIVQAYGDASMWTQTDNVYVTKMNSIISGKQKGFVLELQIPMTNKELPDEEKKVKVASMEADIITLDNRRIVKKTDLYVTLMNEVEEIDDQGEENTNDVEVMKNFYRVKTSLVMSDAKKLAEEGKFEESKKVLQSFKEELENSQLKGESRIQNLIKDFEKAIVYVKPEVYRGEGRHKVQAHTRFHMKQKACFDSADYFQEKGQVKMMEDLEKMKNN